MTAFEMTAIPLAHAGHWAAGLLYLLPVFILAGGVFWQRRNDRLAEESGSEQSGDEQSDDERFDDDVPFTDE